MIRKRVSRELEPHAPEMPEESLRIADSRDRVHALAAELLRPGTAPGIEEVAKFAALEPHRETGRFRRQRSDRRLGGVAVAGIEHDCVHCREAGRPLAQRSRRQQPSVAEAARGVHHAQLDVPRKSVVLQSVVAHEDVAGRLRREKRPAGGDAVRPGPHLAAAAAGEQHRFISARVGIRIGQHAPRRA